MLALVNGMDAASELKNLTACSGYTIMLSTWMDDVNSTNTPTLINASVCQ